MKKVICFVVCCIAMLAVISCGYKIVSNTNDISVTGADGTVYHSYQTACSKGDFDAALDYVEKMKEHLVLMDNSSYEESKKIEAYHVLVEEAEKYVTNEEFNYLASLNEEQANNRIILMLNQQPIEGLEASEMACLGKRVEKLYIGNNYSDTPKEIEDFRTYISWCKKYNSSCSKIMSIAIACGNQSLASKILHCFRMDPEFLLNNEKKGKKDVFYYDVYAHYTNESKEAAQKKYDEAVKSGAFN